jgi:hypothetical protein
LSTTCLTISSKTDEEKPSNPGQNILYKGGDGLPSLAWFHWLPLPDDIFLAGKQCSWDHPNAAQECYDFSSAILVEPPTSWEFHTIQAIVPGWGLVLALDDKNS